MKLDTKALRYLNPTDWRVFLVGIAWIMVMTFICYVGVDISANLQKFFLVIEIIVMIIFAVTTLVRVGQGTAGPQAIDPS